MPGRYRDAAADKPIAFAPGMVTTVEPGIYVHRDLDCDPNALKELGVRIEDDLLVTAGGYENLTAAIPKRVDELEALVGSERTRSRVNVLLLGGSGFMGRHLANALKKRGDEVAPYRSRCAIQRPPPSSRQAATPVVNLAGEPVAQRWNDVVKERIVYSRTELPRRFLAALGVLERKTSIYVSASGIGYYGISETETFVETSPPGTDFLAQSLRRRGKLKRSKRANSVAYGHRPHRSRARTRRRRALETAAPVPIGPRRTHRQRAPVVFVDPHR